MGRTCQDAQKLFSLLRLSEFQVRAELNLTARLATLNRIDRDVKMRGLMAGQREYLISWPLEFNYGDRTDSAAAAGCILGLLPSTSS